MNIQFNAKDFLQKFKIVAAATPTTPRSPILENVKIVADKKSGVLLSATDVEHGICCRVDATVTKNGQALVPAKEFRNALESAKSEQTTLESIEETHKVRKTIRTVYKPRLRWGKTGYEFEPTHPDEYPDIAEFTEKSYYKMEPNELLDLLEHTMFAVADGKTIGTGRDLTGVWLEDHGNKIIAVGTDAKHLAVKEGQGGCVGKHQFSWMSKEDENKNEPRALYPIIPTTSLKTLVKALKEKSIRYPKSIKLAFVATKKDNFTKTHLFLDAGVVRFVTRLVEARSQPWQQIVADAGGMPCATVDSGQLLAAIKKSEIIPSTAYSGMSLTFERNKLTVAGKKKDYSSVESHVPMTYSGKKVTMELNQDCFMSMLKAIRGNIFMYAPIKPGGVLKVDVNDGKFCYVILTIK